MLAAAAVISLGGCAIAGGAGGTRETLPPLPPPGGVLVNKPPLPEPRPVVVEQPTETAPPLDDDANPASVAGRFLAAVRDGNDGAATALVLPGRDPGVFGWARETFENYTSVQGPDSWGSPSSRLPVTPRSPHARGSPVTTSTLVLEARRHALGGLASAAGDRHRRHAGAHERRVSPATIQ